jgi:hypothetical protein
MPASACVTPDLWIGQSNDRALEAKLPDDFSTYTTWFCRKFQTTAHWSDAWNDLPARTAFGL